MPDTVPHSGPRSGKPTPIPRFLLNRIIDRWDDIRTIVWLGIAVISGFAGAMLLMPHSPVLSAVVSLSLLTALIIAVLVRPRSRNL